MGRIKWLGINLIFLFLSIFLSLIIAELVVRLGNIGQDTFWQPDKTVGYALIPGKGGFWKTEGMAYVKVNTKGLRDREHAYEKKPGTYRILVLGDSFMEAVQVPFEKSFPALLEEKLNSLSWAHRFEVINMSMSGFGTTQEYIYFLKAGVKYNPDLVILAFYIGNDISDNSFALQTFRTRPFFELKNGRLNFDPQRKFYSDNWIEMVLRKYSRLYAIIQFRKDLLIRDFSGKAKQASIEDKVFSKVYDSQWQEAWEITKNLIISLKNTVQNSGSRFYMFSIPAGIQVYDNLLKNKIQKYPELSSLGLDLEKPDRLLVDFLKINGIGYYSLLQDFRDFLKEHPDSELYFNYPGHFTPSGHALAAELVSEDLVKRGLLVQ